MLFGSPRQGLTSSKSALTASIFLLVFLVPPVATAFTFGTDFRVNDDPPGIHHHRTLCAGQRCVAALGDTVYVVWQDSRASWGGVYFARSLNGGVSFEPNVMVDDAGMGGNPSLAVGPSGEIYVVWIDDRHHSGGQVYFDRSLDCGVTFGEDAQVDAIIGVDRPSVAVCGVTGYVYVGWADGRTGETWHVFVSRSEDGGASFSPSVKADDNSEWAMATWPVVAVGPDEAVYVAWRDNRFIETNIVAIARSDDRGSTFSSSVQAIEGDTAPALQVSTSGTVYICAGYSWYDLEGHRQQRLWVARSFDRAGSFVDPVTVADLSVESGLAVDLHDRLYLAFRGYNSEQILFSYSPDGGATFTPPIEIDDVQDPLVKSYFPSLAVDVAGGSVYVVWTDTRDVSPYEPFEDIYFDTGLFQTAVDHLTDPGEFLWDPGAPGLRAGPSPFRAETSLWYSLPRGERTPVPQLRIYDIQGRLIRNFELAVGQDVGVVVWDGVGCSGRALPSGIYFAQLSTRNAEVTTRIVRVK